MDAHGDEAAKVDSGCGHEALGREKRMVAWKDSVFSKLFEDRGNVLRLYQTLHPEDLDATEYDIEVITLENVLTTALYNDLGFMVGGRLVILVEAQSTWTPNIIPRAFLYLAHTCQRLIAKKEWSIYARKKIPLPKPEIYVVYTGSEDVAEGMHSFAEEFLGGDDEFGDVKVCVARGGGGDILSQYVAFTKVLDEQVRLHGRTVEAVAETIRICKDGDILRDFLREHEMEVHGIMSMLFNDEELLDTFIKDERNEARREGWNDGWNDGRREGLNDGMNARGKRVFLNLVGMGMSMEDAKRVAEIDDALVEEALRQ